MNSFKEQWLADPVKTRVLPNMDPLVKDLIGHAKYLRAAARGEVEGQDPAEYQDYLHLETIFVPQRYSATSSQKLPIDQFYYNKIGPQQVQRLYVARGTDLSGAMLRGIDFSGADLRRVNFTGADLRGVNFEGCKLTVDNFRNARLHERDIAGAAFYSANGRPVHGVKVGGERILCRESSSFVRNAFSASAFFVRGGFVCLMIGDINRAFGRPAADAAPYEKKQAAPDALPYNWK